jgi:hypothetical protein
VRRIRFRAALLGIGLVALAGCGGGGGGTTAASAPAPPSAPAAQPSELTQTVETTTAPAPTQTSTSPEDQPGGAGDETPIATQALFTGKGGDITPATVRVPPFIAVKVVLRSADGGDYKIEVASHELEVEAEHPKASVTLSGLRAGKRYAVEVVGAPERLSIVANAEPGP